jgi:hypothetical protein
MDDDKVAKKQNEETHKNKARKSGNDQGVKLVSGFGNRKNDKEKNNI